MSDAAQRNRHLFLDGAAGWSAASLEHISIAAPELDLVLDSLAGTMQPLGSGDLKTLECVGALAADPCRKRWLLVDRAAARLRWLDVELERLEEVPGIGGRGPRGLVDPAGVAVLDDGSIAVTDRGSRTVRIFSPFPHALLQLWRDFDDPRGVVAAKDVLWIADRGRRVVREMRRDGTLLATLGQDLLREPVNVAIAPSGILAVADRVAGVVLFEADREPLLLEAEGGAESVAFGDDGALYAGTANGLIHKYAVPPGGTQYQPVGVSVTGLDTGAVTQLLFSPKHGLVAVVRGSTGARLFTAAVAGAFVDRGTYVSEVLDSRLEECEWHRLELTGEIPEGTSIEVTSETAETREALEGKFEREHTHVLGTGRTDCLILSPPGRYLRLRLRLTSSARSSPRIHALKLFFPRESYLQYLPAIYQEDPESRKFLARFLSIFQASFDALDDRIDDLWQLFEPMAVPAKYLPWLAGWLALPLAPDWSEAKKREVLDRGFREERRRGTVAGLEQAIRDYAGVEEAHIVEHFRVRRWARLGESMRLCAGSRLWSRGFYDRMQLEAWSRIGYFRLTGTSEPGMESADWGANEFSVFFVAPDIYSAAEAQKRVEQVVEREKPAHTRAHVFPVFPRFRVGVQSTLEIDTVVGDVSHLVLNRHATLGCDSILACSSFEHAVRGSVLGRTGSDPQLL